MVPIVGLSTVSLIRAEDDQVGGPFDLIAGLPVHPLVVHAAVVLLPLAAVALVVAIAVPRWRAWLGWLSVAGLAVATGAVFVAKESGEALAARVGEPERHAELGDTLPLLAAALFLVALAWLLMARRDERRGRRSAATTALAIGSVVVAVVNIVWVILVGHSGAQAVWGGEVSAAASAAAQEPAGDAGPGASVPAPAGTAEAGTAPAGTAEAGTT